MNRLDIHTNNFMLTSKAMCMSMSMTMSTMAYMWSSRNGSAQLNS